MSVRRAAAALLCALLAACGPPRRQPRTWVPAEPPTFEDDLELASLRQAIERTGRAVSPESAAAAARLLRIIETTGDPEARATAIERSFRVLRLSEPILLTAYYEPELAARRTPDDEFRYPLYARPPDLVDVDPAVFDTTCQCPRAAGRLDGNHVRPYPTRADIDAGALAGRQLEIAWTADPIQLFALHVQGSGRLRFEDGTVVRVGYAATNGRPYHAVAPALVERGALPAGPTTWPEIRRALEDLSGTEQAAVLATNQRYTFFRIAPDGDPAGSLGVPLTPGRSIAADARLVVPGAVAYLATGSVRRFVVSQDAGAAIVGARADLFLGAGTDAEARAGTMREHGTMYILVPR